VRPPFGLSVSWPTSIDGPTGELLGRYDVNVNGPVGLGRWLANVAPLENLGDGNSCSYVACLSMLHSCYMKLYMFYVKCF